MALTQIIVLALIQGITEFLPISSSAHLILVPVVTDWPDQGLAMDVAVHLGTLGAVIVYFWRDLVAMGKGIWLLLKGRRDPQARLAGQIIVATIPILAVGYGFAVYVGELFRSVTVIAWATIGFGVLLYIVDRMMMTVRRLAHVTYLDAIIVGLAQVLALVPGTSRSGITITAARLLGFERHDAARLSMLISIPTIAASGLWLGLRLYQNADLAITRDAAIAASFSFVAAIIAITAMMAWIKKSSFTPFVAYRVILGISLLVASAYDVI